MKYFNCGSNYFIISFKYNVFLFVSISIRRLFDLLIIPIPISILLSVSSPSKQTYYRSILSTLLYDMFIFVSK